MRMSAGVVLGLCWVAAMGCSGKDILHHRGTEGAEGTEEGVDQGNRPCFAVTSQFYSLSLVHDPLIQFSFPVFLCGLCASVVKFYGFHGAGGGESGIMRAIMAMAVP